MIKSSSSGGGGGSGDGDTCKQVCERASTSKSVKLVASSHVTYTQGVRTFSVCQCYFDAEETTTSTAAADEFSDAISSFRTCTYLVSSGKDLKAKLSDKLVEGSPVHGLLKVVLVEGGGSGGRKIELAGSMIASIYYRGLHYVNSYYAILLLTILFGGTLFLLGSSNFFAILKHPGQIWSVLTGTDFKAKAAQVVLAITFFGLPVPYTAIKADAPNPAERVVYGNVTDTACFNAIADLSEAQSNFNECIKKCVSEGKFRDENCTAEVSQSSEEEVVDSPTASSFVSFCRTKTDLERYETAYEESCKKAGGLQEEPPRFRENETADVPKIKEKFYVPFSLAFVQGFVNFGVSTAERIANWGSEAVKQYFLYKMTEGSISYSKSVTGLSIYAKEFQNYRVEGKIDPGLVSACVKGGISGDGGGGGGSGGSGSGNVAEVCTAILDKKNHDFKSPYCASFIEQVRSLCAAFRPPQNVSVDDFIKALQEQASAIQQRYVEGFNQAQGKFSFLAPAIIPAFSVAYPFTMLNQKLNTFIVAELTGGGVEEESFWSMVDRYLGVVKSGVWKFLQTSYYAFTGQADRAMHTLFPAGPVDQAMDQALFHHGWRSWFGFSDAGYVLGYVSIMTAVPPGSYVERFLSQVAGALAKSSIGLLTTFVLTGLGGMALLSKIGSALLSGGMGLKTLALGTGLTALAASSLVAGFILTLLVKIAAANVTSVVLFVLPFLAIFIAGVIRFIHYLYEIVKTVVVLPFYALPVATRRTEGAFLFFGDLIKLSAVPMLIAASVTIACAFALAIEYFFFDLPLSIMLSQVGPGSFSTMFLLGVMTAIFQLLTSFLGIYFGYKFTVNFPDYVLSQVGRLFQFTMTQGYQDVGQQALMLMKKKFFVS